MAQKGLSCGLTTFVIAALFSCLVAGMARADQKDPELTGLFQSLQATANKDFAAQLQQEIWERWTAFETDQTINARMQDGVQLMNQGALRQAETLFGALGASAPDFAEVWNKRATVRFMIGDYAGSKQDIARVLALEPRHFGALSGLGMIHAHEGNFKGALIAYEAAARQNPHMTQVEQMITQLERRLKGEAL